MNSSGSVYSDLQFPDSPPDRPYAFINMVATIDGKTVSGTPEDPVSDLGSPVDHQAMRRLEMAADAILIGAGNLRSTPNLWYPRDKYRIVATRSGNLDYSSRFFVDAPSKALVIAPPEANVPDPFPRLDNDFKAAFRQLRLDYKIERLLVEGGAHLNGQLIPLNLIDELFLTLAPKVKLGTGLPTYAEGPELERGNLLQYELVENWRVENELFLRYRRK